MNEMHALREMRSDVPLPPDGATRAAEARLVAAIRREPARRRVPTRRFAWGAGLATGLAAAVAVGVVLVPGDTAKSPDRAPGEALETNAAKAPPLKLTSATQVLDLAATATKGQPELAPRPDQYVVVRSTTMYGAEAPDGRYLYRTNRTVWRSVDGTRDGAAEITYLEPVAYGSEPIPRSAGELAGRVQRVPMRRCPGTPLLNEYAKVVTLPTTAEGMLAHLRSTPANKNPLDQRTFTAAADLVRETYLPPAQRAALYRALALIPGLELVQGATDAAGRTGVAVGYRDAGHGVREELVFDPQTLQYLGERQFVIDAAVAGAPVGTQVASTAVLSVEVADTAPTYEEPTKGLKGEPACG